jgi:hypothetical protein
VSPLRIAAVVACLLGCSRGATDSHESDASVECCPITENPKPGACVDLGGAASPETGFCVTTCDGPNDFVRTIDELGCPKLVDRACADGGGDPSLCR